MNRRTAELAKTATLRMDTVKIETVEYVAPVKKMNAALRIVENVEFAKRMPALTAANFALFALNARMKNASPRLNVALKTLVGPVKTVLTAHVLLLTVEDVVHATMPPMSVKQMNPNARQTVEFRAVRHVLVTLERLALNVSMSVLTMTKAAAVLMTTANAR